MAEEDVRQEEVKTLFIAGLPDDVKEREIYNLFRNYPGYQSCQLKYTGRGYQIVAFAVFSDQASAITAKEALHGIKFDPHSTTTLHIDLAKENSRIKRSRGDDGVASGIDKKPRVPACVIGGMPDSGVGGTMHMPGLVNSVYSDMSGYPPSQSGSVIGPPPYAAQDGIPGMAMGPTLFPPLPAPGSNPPCSTLFVANLGPTCTEAELAYVFASFPGFIKLKMQSRGGLPVAFAEFQDELYSTQALMQLQNFVISSSNLGGMHLEYAKSRMGLPRRERRN